MATAPGNARTLADTTEEFRAFWAERHLATLTTIRPDGTPHVVPVGVTLDLETGTARVITSANSRKARNVAEAGTLAVAVCQVDGGRWSTLEGDARVRTAADAVAEGVRRYAERYREPRENPERVVIEIAVQRVLGSV
jgi:PPOX class probable F420-dependent enzyme